MSLPVAHEQYLQKDFRDNLRTGLYNTLLVSPHVNPSVVPMDVKDSVPAEPDWGTPVFKQTIPRPAKYHYTPSVANRWF